MANTNQANIAQQVHVSKEETPYVINPRQLTAILTCTMLGMGVFTLPRVAAYWAHESAWMSILLGMLAAFFGMSLITRLNQRFTGQTVVIYSQQLLGKKGTRWGTVLSFPLLIGLTLLWAAHTGTLARAFGEVITAVVLRETPMTVIMFLMLAAAMYMAMHEAEVIARVNELIFVLTFVPLLLLYLLSFQNVRWENLLPLFSVDWRSFLISVAATSIAFAGFEIMLVLGAFTQPIAAARRAQYVGIAIPALMNTLSTLAAIATFSYEEVKRIMWPALEMAISTEFPGAILERMEAAVLAIWFLLMHTAIGNLYFSASKIVQEYFRIRHHQWVVLAMFPFLLVLALWPKHVHQVYEWMQVLGVASVVFWLGGPVLLLIAAQIRQPQRRNPSKPTQPGP